MRFIIANAAQTQYQRLLIFQLFVGNLFLFTILSAVEISPEKCLLTSWGVKNSHYIFAKSRA